MLAKAVEGKSGIVENQAVGCNLGLVENWEVLTGTWFLSRPSM